MGGFSLIILFTLLSIYSGRELFLSDASLFVDDAEAYDIDRYQREPEADVTEQVVGLFLSSL